MHMASDRYETASIVKGHHVYKSIWTPVISQELLVKPEDDNEHDKNTVSVIRGDCTVGHIPRTTSGVSHSFVIRGSVIVFNLMQ